MVKDMEWIFENTADDATSAAISSSSFESDYRVAAPELLLGWDVADEENVEDRDCGMSEPWIDDDDDNDDDDDGGAEVAQDGRRVSSRRSQVSTRLLAVHEAAAAVGNETIPGGQGKAKAKAKAKAKSKPRGSKGSTGRQLDEGAAGGDDDGGVVESMGGRDSKGPEGGKAKRGRVDSTSLDETAVGPSKGEPSSKRKPSTKSKKSTTLSASDLAIDEMKAESEDRNDLDVTMSPGARASDSFDAKLSEGLEGDEAEAEVATEGDGARPRRNKRKVGEDKDEDFAFAIPVRGSRAKKEKKEKLSISTSGLDLESSPSAPPSSARSDRSPATFDDNKKAKSSNSSSRGRSRGSNSHSQSGGVQIKAEGGGGEVDGVIEMSADTQEKSEKDLKAKEKDRRKKKAKGTGMQFEEGVQGGAIDGEAHGHGHGHGLDGSEGDRATAEIKPRDEVAFSSEQKSSVPRFLLPMKRLMLQSDIRFPTSMMRLMDFWMRCLHVMRHRVVEAQRWAQKAQRLIDRCGAATSGSPRRRCRQQVEALLATAAFRGIKVKQR